MVDWEGEFACVIGKTCHQVTVDEAMDYVAGYTLINDVSARDWVKPFLAANGAPMEVAHRALDNIMGKQYPTFCPIGPCIVTKDELTDPGKLTITTRVNGEVMQHADTADLIFSLAQTISHFSRWYQFLPGDIITTGTPSGVGYAHVPPRFLRPGDVVEVHVEEIGALRNPVVAASTASADLAKAPK
jgi:2-keto-4-pentenoate hydratase/2-oxohepta-3-ene-1,7-dioic acid hydratase in catechol pathway